MGSGPAGITIAHELRTLKKKIIVLEAGGLEHTDQSQEFYKGESPHRTYDPKGSRLRYFGGTSNHWAGWCASLQPFDFYSRPWVAESGWPIQASALKGFYQEASNYLDIFDEDYDQLRSELHPISEDDRFYANKFGLDFRYWQVSRPTRFKRKFAELFKQDIDLFYNASVTKIELGSSLKAVDFVTVKSLQNQIIRVKAQIFVLACGGIENARVLLNLRSQIESGIGNQSDSVGRYFMEHPHLNLGFLVGRKQIKNDFYKMIPPRAADIKRRLGLISTPIFQ